MADEFLADNLVIYIEKEIAATFSTDSIIDYFKSRKKCRVQLSIFAAGSSKVIIRKTLYGLKQVSHEWFEKFSITFIIGSDVDGIFDFKASIHHTFEMKDLGSLSYFLGLEVISSYDDIYLSQVKYVSDLLTRVRITDSRTKSIPLELNIQFTPMDGTVLDNHTLYRQLVGDLIYLTVTRPDIAYPVHVLSQLLSTHRTTHYAIVFCIFCYIKSSLFQGLYFSAHSFLILQAYSDTD
ncbi:uncharacterized mitochondrial protein AtMg00810-like [Arachis duranensis]|uniref:Uncharacterized mitochondrial protein AtMg00810-like n=1 Tax=Arachis duranensis TaxID=130453 RepID=A0A6P4CM73_ARADU|nr:uncharacterized mitochondrial protein AtMg00810-like [Arachis duranensis]XP_052117497.1 uncharacterized mitochondrial protein AtMg00810-like [Arachis duranensis]